ncbi:MAG TPA: hypothetical protein VNW51_06560, partial [Mucilaginibacter sp.]|nr:hypothetical protein [Mucilaginibacter sp.]
AATTRNASAIAAINYCQNPTPRIVPSAKHAAVKAFKPGEAVSLQISFATTPAKVKLYYRHVDMAERFESVDMQTAGGNFTATIPAEYTKASYPITYYFEVEENAHKALYPGFAELRNNQPYFVIRKA